MFKSYKVRVDSRTFWEGWILADSKEEAIAIAETGGLDEVSECDVDTVHSVEILREEDNDD